MLTGRQRTEFSKFFKLADIPRSFPEALQEEMLYNSVPSVHRSSTHGINFLTLSSKQQQWNFKNRLYKDCKDMVVVDGRLLLMAAACSPSSPGSTILTSRPTRNKALKIIIGVSNFVKKSLISCSKWNISNLIHRQQHHVSQYTYNYFGNGHVLPLRRTFVMTLLLIARSQYLFLQNLCVESLECRLQTIRLFGSQANVGYSKFNGYIYIWSLFRQHGQIWW